MVLFSYDGTYNSSIFLKIFWRGVLKDKFDITYDSLLRDSEENKYFTVNKFIRKYITKYNLPINVFMFGSSHALLRCLFYFSRLPKINIEIQDLDEKKYIFDDNIIYTNNEYLKMLRKKYPNEYYLPLIDQIQLNNLDSQNPTPMFLLSLSIENYKPPLLDIISEYKIDNDVYNLESIIITIDNSVILYVLCGNELNKTWFVYTYDIHQEDGKLQEIESIPGYSINGIPTIKFNNVDFKDESFNPNKLNSINTEINCLYFYSLSN